MLLACALAGCATAPAIRPGEPDCPVVGGPVVDRERPWTFAVLEGTRGWTRIDSPTTDSEAVLLAHFYEGLTRLDCGGQVLPALAATWADSAGGRVWTFELREDARFDNGAPVDAAAVDRCWARARRHAEGTGASVWGGLSLRAAERGAATVRIVLETPDPDLPRRLSRPEFRITDEEGRNTRGKKGQWSTVERGEVIASCPGETVRFRYARERDARDAFTDDVDALVTRDADALRYLAERPGVRLTPLPWSRRYVLRDPGARLGAIRAMGASLRSELARDVVRSVARAAEPLAGNPGTTSRRADPADDAARRIRYAREDPDAKRIAERLASLASREGSAWTVEPASAAELESGEGASVVSVPTWDADARAPDFPLVETRAFLVTRDPLAGITVDGYGIPFLGDAGFARAEDER
jgi:hypothetical protein